MIGTFAYAQIKPKLFQPLTFETVRVQFVDEKGVINIPQVEGFEAPSVSLGSSVPLFFERCSTELHPFEAVFNAKFLNRDTGVEYVHTSNGKATIEPGCVQLRIPFLMPQQMIIDLQQFGESGPIAKHSSWSIIGSVTGERRGSKPSYWQSEVFTVVHTPASLPGN